jgi:hypothetical protein
MAKTDFEIQIVSKAQAATILLRYHYLKDISKGFKSGINYGLFKGDELVGVIIYTGFPVPELSVGMFGLPREDQDGFYELSRLCLSPEIQSQEQNLASWFVSKSIKMLRKAVNVRAILSYADADFHNGTVYFACNFTYYGLSTVKTDFWILQEDGTYIKHSRGPTKGVAGEWRLRSQKHRFVIVYDQSLTIRWTRVEKSKDVESWT